MINKIIRNFIAKQMAGRSDDGIMITLKDPQKVELGENIMADLLMRNGIDPRTITSEQQLKNIINQIEAASKQTTQTGIRNTESAKVFNTAGEELDPSKPIMGGTQEGKKINQDFFIRNAEAQEKKGMFDNIFNKMQNERKGLKAIDDDLPPPGSRGGKEDIAAPVQSEDEIMKKIDQENKEARRNLQIKLSKDKGYQKFKGETEEEIRKRFKLDDDPQKKADGGIMRLGFKDGMNRRTFLKFLAGAASIPIVGKIFKPLKVGKTVSKVPIIKTADVPGKPEWFDQLVNKVIIEGDDVTKRFATQERQVVHMKKIDEDTTVKVTQDLDDGAVRVEYENPDNVFGDPVQMQYKKPLPDEDMPKGGAAEFEVAESGPISRQVGPDDYDMDIDEVGGISIKDLDSDVSKLKTYATGQKPTMKEFVQNKKRKDRAKNITEDQEAQMDAVIRRQGEYDGPYDDDFASGGIARMLGE